MASSGRSEVIDLVSSPSSSEDENICGKSRRERKSTVFQLSSKKGAFTKSNRVASSRNTFVTCTHKFEKDRSNKEHFATHAQSMYIDGHEKNDTSLRVLDRQDTDQNQPVVITFLNSDGSDNAVVTDGLLAVLEKIPSLVTCSSTRSTRLLSNNEERVPQSQAGTHIVPRGANMPSTLFHIQQNDKWSCGFRNLQMVLSALLPHLPGSHPFFADRLLPNSLKRITSPESIITPLPSLQQLQTFLEESWADGFDKKGAQHYNGSIVGRTSKIGAVEVSSCLAYLDIDSAVVQFIKCRESRSLLGDFVLAYFTKKSGPAGCCFCCTASRGITLISSTSLSTSACATELLKCAARPSNTNGHERIQTGSTCKCPTLPLYLQWEGHSVTIVGVEQKAAPNQSNETSMRHGNITLLVFDPMKNGTKLKEDLVRAASDHDLKANDRETVLPSCIRMSSSKLLKKDCQIIMCSIRPLTAKEKSLSREQVNAITAAKAAVVRSMQR